MKHRKDILEVDHKLVQFMLQHPEMTNAQVAAHFKINYHRVDNAVRRSEVARKVGRPRKEVSRG